MLLAYSGIEQTKFKVDDVMLQVIRIQNITLGEW